MFTVFTRSVAGFFQEDESGEPLDILLDGPIANGMSGGPVVDEKGKVVGINQVSDGTSGGICSAREIREFLK